MVYMHHIVKLSSDETVIMKALEHQLNGVSEDQRQFMTPQWLPLLLRYQLEERS